MNGTSYWIDLPREFWDALDRSDIPTAGLLLADRLHQPSAEATKREDDDSFLHSHLPYFKLDGVNWDDDHVAGSLTLTPRSPKIKLCLFFVPFYLEFLSGSVEIILPVLDV